jgi:hypothetical protein
MFATLLDRIARAGAVVPADAMHAQRALAEYSSSRLNWKRRSTETVYAITPLAAVQVNASGFG